MEQKPIILVHSIATTKSKFEEIGVKSLDATSKPFAAISKQLGISAAVWFTSLIFWSAHVLYNMTVSFSHILLN